MYLFKLIDEEQCRDIMENRRISLSRPLFEFGSPEGIIEDFFRYIDKSVRQQPDINLIEPTPLILNTIREWYQYYSESSGSTSDDIYSDLRIQINTYFQTYCGYYTKTDLFNDSILESYCQENKKFVRQQRKTHVLKIKVPYKEKECTQWELKQDLLDDSVFLYNANAKMYENNIVSYLKICPVVYLDPHLNYKDIFNLFNHQDQRFMSAFFKYSKSYLKSQRETRLILYVPSYKRNKHTLAIHNLFPQQTTPLENRLFYYSLSVYHEIKEHFPRYVYLGINEFNIKPIGIGERQ